jgi:hypothetical protein
LSRQENLEITIADREALRRAVQSLEHPSLAARLTNIVGKPVELIGYALPSFASKAIAFCHLEGTRSGAQARVAHAARFTPGPIRNFCTEGWLRHRRSGRHVWPGGAPCRTARFDRHHAAFDRGLARSEGEDLSDPEATLSCVEMFALGGRAGSADASESGYFAVRGVLAKTVTEAAKFVAERGVLKEGAPILLKFVTQVAARFGLVVTQKVAAQALPVVGALGGAAVNYAFIEHFQDVARGHFTVRRLERIYGKERIRSEYDSIAREL